MEPYPTSGNGGGPEPARITDEGFLQAVLSRLDEFDLAVLERRASLLAQRSESQTDAEDYLEVLTFVLGSEKYAIEVASVRRVMPLEQITPVPCTPLFVAGVISLSGEILPLLDIRHFLGIVEQGITDLMHIVVVEMFGLKVGLLANRVGEVQSVRLASFDPPPATVSDYAHYLRGVTADGLVLLDLGVVLGDERIIINEEVI